MKTTQIYGIIVRTVGLIVVVASAGFLIPGILSLILGGPLTGLLFYGVPAFFLGLWLLRGARSIVSFAYPEEARNQEAEAEPSAAPNGGPATQPGN
jgi:hypothetical protein